MSRQEKMKQKKIQNQINKLFSDYQMIKLVLNNIDNENENYFASIDGFLVPIKKEIAINYLESKCQQIENILGINSDGDKKEEDVDKDTKETEE
jgi:deoxyribodipyrimidine photolyase-like uncharacterized protein